MAAPKSTTWSLEPHTAAKHAILRRYLSAWLPILSQGSFGSVVYIDAFAGPGVYLGGEDGSPVIALKELIGHRTKIKSKTIFHFVELDDDRAVMLEQRVQELLASTSMTGHLESSIHRSSFEEAYPKILRSMAPGVVPAFAFIDAFGWTGFPFSLVEDILKRRSCEVLINFMYEEINRFIGHPDQEANFDKLFGCPEWRACVGISVPAERNRSLRTLYESQLKRRAKYVRTFEMRNRANTVDYYLFFATNNLLGLKRMKASMWKVDDSGDFRFSDATNPGQMTFFDEPQFHLLTAQVLARFAGRRATIEQVEEFVLTDTPFRESHIRNHVLGPLEADSKITVLQAKPGRRRGQYPAGTVIDFSP